MAPVQARQVNVGRRKAHQPFVEGIMRDRSLQPYIHNISAMVADGRHLYRFMVFVKKHRRARRNRCLQALIGGGNRRVRIRSDVVVMRRTDYVAMDGPHARAADWLMRVSLFFILFCLEFMIGISHRREMKKQVPIRITANRMNGYIRIN